MDGLNLYSVLYSLAALALICLALLFYWLATARKPLSLRRLVQNPVLAPNPDHWWESEAVFNPGAVVHGGKVHLFYRALGQDGISRIGYAVSHDGIHFKRQATPAYEPGPMHKPDPNQKLSYQTLTYDTVSYASGGGWGGAEDPRAVIMDDTLYLTFTAFQNWASERITLTSIPLKNLDKKLWTWAPGMFLSPPGEVQKNWLLFPTKINGKYAILHSVTPKIKIEYVKDLAEFDGTKFIMGSVRQGGRAGHWDTVVRGAGTPPIKTAEGWLVLYHGFDPASGPGYKVGAMLLDLENPEKVLYRSDSPILEPDVWYENDWKPGVVYASGAVIFHDDLLVYYGGGDKYVAAAKHNLQDFLHKLTTHQQATLEPVALQ